MSGLLSTVLSVQVSQNLQGNVDGPVAPRMATGTSEVRLDEPVTR
jgi:hypothetical protein